MNNKTEENVFFAKKVLEEIIPLHVSSYVKNSLKENSENLTKRQDNILETLANGKYLDSENKAGFKITKGRFHVCALLDESYILYDPVNKQYYGFGPDFGQEPGIIGVPVAKERDTISINAPVFINKYKHPDLPQHADYQRIDTGHYMYPRETDEKDFSGTMIDILHNVIKCVTKGYGGMNEWKKFHSNESYWRDHLLNPEQVDKSQVSNKLVSEMKMKE
ncbi:MAG: hypothetical protein R6U32_05335 [Candidatus Woesearchaeota archaeon]